MMNVLEIQDNLKNFSEQQLVKEMQQPSGSTPQFLVLSELNRRKRVKGDFEARQSQNQPTVAQDVVASAGVPQQGMMGMSEAMAPQSIESGGIGSMMPKTMKNGGEVEGYAEGGVIRAKAGEYFPSSNELYGIYGQESGFGKNLFGSAGEIGPYQILPTTAISPGYGIQSLFPELAQAVAEGKYKDFNEAYLDNKDAVDSVLMSGEKTEPFVKSYLDAAENKLGSRDKALLSYNQGIAGTKNFNEDASKTNYVSGIMSNMQGFDGAKMSRPTFTDGDVKKTKVLGTTTTNNKTNEDDKDRVDGRGFVKKLFDIVPTPDDSLSGFEGSEKGNVPQFYKDIQKQLEQREENKRKNENPNEEINLPSGTYEDKIIRDLKIAQKQEQLLKEEAKENEERVDDRNPVMKALGLIPTPDDSLSGFEDMLKTDPDKSFLFGEKGLDILKEGRKKRLAERKLLKDGFYFPEDSLSGLETFDMGSPDGASEEVTKGTADALRQGEVDAKKAVPEGKPLPEATTALSSLQQELLNRQDQMKKDRDFDKYMALAQAGLSIMSSDKPTLAGAIGEGGTAGLEAFRGAQKRYQEGLNDILNARVKLAGKKGSLSQKEAISSIASIDSAIAKYRTDADKAVDPAAIKKIQDAIAQLNFQKRSLMPTAGYSYLNTDVSDTTAAKG